LFLDTVIFDLTECNDYKEQQFYHLLDKMFRFFRRNKSYQIRNPDQCCRKECWTSMLSSSAEFGAKTETGHFNELLPTQFKITINCLYELLKKTFTLATEG
jgi:hypothetical protein